MEKAVIEKAVKSNKFFEGDKDFFREADDIGMCMSMHQPWASKLLVLADLSFGNAEITFSSKIGA